MCNDNYYGDCCENDCEDNYGDNDMGVGHIPHHMRTMDDYYDSLVEKNEQDMRSAENNRQYMSEDQFNRCRVAYYTIDSLLGNYWAAALEMAKQTVEDLIEDEAEVDNVGSHETSGVDQEQIAVLRKEIQELKDIIKANNEDTNEVPKEQEQPRNRW